jgi:hypothetical protein
MKICRACGNSIIIDLEMNLYRCKLTGKDVSGNCECKTGQYITGTAEKIEMVKKAKYNNKKTIAGEQEFDSEREAIRYGELKLLQQANEITALQTQVPFLLEPKNDKNRAEYYIADFVYFDYSLKDWVVEDAKGVRTQVYINKKKSMYNKYGIDIKEV